MFILKTVFYGIFGALLSSVGVKVMEGWQFWALLGCIAAVDIISGLTRRA